MEKVDHEDADALEEKVSEIKQRWRNLCNASNDRQLKLEEALIQLGQFTIAVEELLIWITQTKEVLQEKQTVPKDKKLIEVELEKLKVSCCSDLTVKFA